MDASFRIESILHSTLIVQELAVSLRFYRDVLGLALDESRPDLGYPGAWLQVGPQQVHLMELPNPDPRTGRPEHGGRDRHTALAVSDVNALQVRLEEAGYSCTRSKSGRPALFTRDPDGNALEFIEINQ